jgi:hypothetical protein
METIKAAIEGVMQVLGQKKQDRQDYPRLLRKVLTKRELGHIKFNHFRAGVLNLAVDSSAWLYKFSLEKKKILDKLKLGAGEIKDIRFRLGEIK